MNVLYYPTRGKVRNSPLEVAQILYSTPLLIATQVQVDPRAV